MPPFNHERDSLVNTFVSRPAKTIVFMDSIASRLKSSREGKGWTQGRLAKEAGVSQGTVGNIESGARRSHGSLPRLAEALGVSHNWLRDGIGQEPQFSAKRTNIGKTVQDLMNLLLDLNQDEQKAAALFLAQMAETQSVRWAGLLTALLESKTTPQTQETVNSDRVGNHQGKAIPALSSFGHNEQAEPEFGPVLTKLFSSGKGAKNGRSTELADKQNRPTTVKKLGGKRS